MQKRQAELNNIKRRQTAGNRSRAQQTFAAYKEKIRETANLREKYGGRKVKGFGTFRPETARVRPTTAKPQTRRWNGANNWERQYRESRNRNKKYQENKARQNQENRTNNGNNFVNNFTKKLKEIRKAKNNGKATPYQLKFLEISNKFSSNNITPNKRYKKLAMNYHPNRGGKTENFQALGNVYQYYIKKTPPL